ncbi:MAG: response regulator [Vicinamibacterales bacterium]
MRILLADDHALVRRGIAHVLREDFPSLTIEEVGLAQMAINLAVSAHWDIVVLDISLPDRDGLDALKEIKRAKPDVPVLMLSLYPEGQYARRALRAGASGYLTKDSAPEELTIAIRRILRGGRYVSSALAEQLAADLSQPTADRPGPERLSDRELEVLRLIGRGETPTQVAQRLGLSVKTVSTYRTRLLEKLEMQTTADLIRFAVDEHLLD